MSALRQRSRVPTLTAGASVLLMLLLVISASLASARSPTQCTFSYDGYYVAANNND